MTTTQQEGGWHPRGYLFLGGDCIYIIKLAEAASHMVPTLMCVNTTFRTHRIPRYKVRHARKGSFTEKVLCIPSPFRRPPGIRLTAVYRTRIKNMHDQFAREIGGQPVVIAPYPFFSRLTDFIPSNSLVYLNFDDYRTYDPRIADFVEEEENNLLERAGLVLCSAIFQSSRFKESHPHKAQNIHHLPSGVYSEFLGSEPPTPKRRNLIGYVGSMSDRIDWRFVVQTVGLCPELEFHFIGEAPHGNQAVSESLRYKAIARGLPNVRFFPAIPQDEVHAHYREFQALWIPYTTSNKFNIASSPTKLFDSFAAGCPVIATDLPEHRLYPQVVTVVGSASKAAYHLRRIVGLPPDKDAAMRRRIWEFARDQTWFDRMKKLNSWLPRDSLRADS